MITGRDLTPEEQSAAIRSNRRQAIMLAIFGVCFLALGLWELNLRKDGMRYFNVAMGAANFGAAAMYWSRARKMEQTAP